MQCTWTVHLTLALIKPSPLFHVITTCGAAHSEHVRTRRAPTGAYRPRALGGHGVREAVPAKRDLSDLFSTGKRRVGVWVRTAEGDMLCPTSVTVYAARASLYPAVDT